MDRGQPISLRGFNRLERQSSAMENLSAIGMQLDSSVGNPILTASPVLSRSCTARITGVANDGSTPPNLLLDDNGYVQYTWVEEERYIDGSGFPAWRDVAIQPRGSRQVGTGIYLNLAHEANGGGGIPTGSHVVVWAGVCNQKTANGPDYEHVFYAVGLLLSFELYDSITPGGHALAYPMNAAETAADTSAPKITVYDVPEGNIRALGSTFMTNSHGARGKAVMGTSGHLEIVSIQQQARRIKVTISTGCVSGGATFVPTALAVMDPGGQDPSNGGVSFPTITNYSTPIGNASGTTDGIKCEWDESLGVYLVYDAPCPVGC